MGPRDASVAGCPLAGTTVSRANESRFGMSCPRATFPAHHHVEDRGPSVLSGGERALQGALQLGAVFDALAMEAEMASQLLIVRSVDGHPEMQIFAGRGAIGIVMDVAHPHRFVFLVVE